MERILFVLVLALFIYELVALRTTRPGDTISEIAWRLSDRWRLFPFLVGVLMGHFFWPKG